MGVEVQVLEPQLEDAGYDGLYAPKDPWKPYEVASLETAIPFFRSLPGAYYRWRWMVLWPMHTRLPRVRLPLLCWRLDRLTVGEVLVGALLLGIAIGWPYKEYLSTSEGVSWSVHPVGMFLLICVLLGFRNSVFTFLLGLSHERGLGWHALTGTVGVLFGIYHGVLEHTVDPRYQGYWDPSDMRRFISGWVGEGLLIALVLLSLVPELRRRWYTLWKASHVILLVLAAGALAAHQVRLIMAIVVIWGLDLALRWGYMAGLRNPHQVALEVLPGRIVRICWPAGTKFKYSGGQYIYINIPAISWAEFHPLSLSSTPNSTRAHVHVRIAGDWTERLLAYAEKGVRPGEVRMTRAFIEGPFGSPEVDLHGDRYAAFLLVAGGIGVTPQQSMYNHLVQQKERGRPVRLLRLVWAVGGAWAVHERTMVPEVARSMRYSSFRSGPTGQWSRSNSVAPGRNKGASAYGGLSSYSIAEGPPLAAAGSPDVTNGAARPNFSREVAASLRHPSNKVAADGRASPTLSVGTAPAGLDALRVQLQQQQVQEGTVDARQVLVGLPELPEGPSTEARVARAAVAKSALPGPIAEATEGGLPPDPAHQQQQQQQHRSEKLDGAATVLTVSYAAGQQQQAAEALKPVGLPANEAGKGEVENFIATEFYLNPDKATSVPGMIPGLTPGMNAGRPDMPAIFQDTGRRARSMGLSRVAVCACGPMSMMDDVRALALELSGSEGAGGVAFDINLEVFDW